MEVPWVVSRFGMDNGVGSYVIFTHIWNNEGRADFRGKIMSSALDMLEWGATEESKWRDQVAGGWISGSGIKKSSQG